MSYLVLARKYRPRNFGEMVGQPHVVTALSNALVQKRLHHAYLFTGTRGVGKTTVSRILAKSLNCVGLDGAGDITAEPCGVCEVCRAIDAGNFVDYTELDAASNRGVEEVQQLLEQAVYKPVQGRFKVFMIDEVHMLTNTAFNAMLKTLEEPPEYLKFVLATTDPQKVPVTVLSRCLQFNLRPIAPETVRDHLLTVLQAEALPAELGALTLLARAARGSMRDALSLTDQAIAFGNGEVREDTVRQMLGAVDRQQVLGLVDSLGRGDGQQVLALIDQARASGLNAAGLLEDMAQVLQQMAVLQVSKSPVPADADTEQQQVHALAQAMPRDETQLLYSICIHGKAEIGLAPDEYAGLTMVLLRLLAYKPAEAEKKTPEFAAVKPVLAMPAPAPVQVLAMPPAPVATPALPSALPPVPAPKPSPAPAPVLAERAAVAAMVPALPSLAQDSPLSEADGWSEPDWGDWHGEPETIEPPPPIPTVAVAAPNSSRPTAPVSSPPPHNAPARPAQTPPWQESGFETLAPAPAPAPAPAQAVSALPWADMPPDDAAPVQTQTAAPIAPSAAVALAADLPALARTDLGDFWYELVNQMVAQELIAAFARELALQSQLVAREAGCWQLNCASGLLGVASNVERLKGALATLGHAVALQVTQAATSDTPALRNQHAQAFRLNAARQLLEQDPFVRALKRDFGATIIDQSVQPL